MRYLFLRIKRFCGFITGFVFFIGSLFKLMDPVGTGLIMKEYLDFLHIGFMGFAAKPLGVLFAFAESLVGIGLITGVWRKTVALVAMTLQAFFTLLTLLLVIFNPEMDCGCFGEAIHLTHTQTFVKNIILCILLATYYFPGKWLGKPKKVKFVSFAVVSASVMAFTIYSWVYIPLVDFTAYKPASALKAGHAFAVEDGDIYEAVFIYEKEGTEQAFSLGHLPDSSWNFVRTQTIAKEGYANEDLLDLSIYNSDGEYMDELASEGRILIASVYDPHMKQARWNRIAQFIKDAETADFKSMLLVSATEDQLDAALSGLAPETASILKQHALFSDYKTLIAMNRSNGGATYFSDGYLIRKGAHIALPGIEELSMVHEEDETETIIGQNTKGSLAFQGFLLYVFAIMLLL